MALNSREFFMGLARRILVFTLILTLSLIGIPLPSYAATGEESPRLTFNGRPLSELLHGRATGAPFPLPALRQQDDGQISGVAVFAEGRPLVDHVVQLRRILTVSRGRAEQIVGKGTTDTAGGFSFTGLQANDYLVEVLSEGVVVASASVTLAEGAIQVSGVIAAPASEGGQFLGPKAMIALIVGAGLLLLFFVGTDTDKDFCGQGIFGISRCR